MKTQEKVRYFLYARKSSESEDRQMASIDSQIIELEKMAQEMGLEVVEAFSESRSAKAPGRPIFNEMIHRLQAGEADGILCWKLNRLARNPIDGGQISWMLQEGVLKQIQTFGRAYCSTDNVIVMAVELGMANQFIRDLSTDTKRGLRAKAERGWYPTAATLGYTHNPYKHKGEKEIIPDPERFDLVRKMWDMMLTGEYNPQKVWEIAALQWGLRSRYGTVIARNTVYRIFSDPFYYGEFEYPKGSGNWIQGQHIPMVTREEFEKVQSLLGRASTYSKTHEFAFRGPITCGECGALITAERKVRTQKNGIVRFYIYYHCTKRKNPNCTQRCIEEKKLEGQIADVLRSIEIPTSFREWAMDILKEQNKDNGQLQEKVMTSHRTEYDKLVKKLHNLIDLRANGEITPEEFAERKGDLLREKQRIEVLLNDTQHGTNEWIDTAEKYLTFAETARGRFEEGDLKTKKSILYALGSKLSLKDQKLTVYLPQALKLMETASRETRVVQIMFETQKESVDKADLATLYSQNPIMLPDQSLILVRLSDQEYLRGITDRLEYIAELQSMTIA